MIANELVSALNWHIRTPEVKYPDVAVTTIRSTTGNHVSGGRYSFG